MKGKQNWIDKTASYRMFVMGDNRWRDEPYWPLQQTREKDALPDKRGSRQYTGRRRRPRCAAVTAGGADHYTYDPRDPVPSLHGAALVQMPTDRRPLADREDILVYQSEPLAERLEVTGNPTVVLHAASSAPDTDFSSYG